MNIYTYIHYNILVVLSDVVIICINYKTYYPNLHPSRTVPGPMQKHNEAS